MGQCDAPSVMLSIGLGEVIRATGKINFIFREEVIEVGTGLGRSSARLVSSPTRQNKEEDQGV